MATLTERQQADFEWFKFKMPELFRMYGHCFVAISNREVLGTFGTYGDAVDAASKLRAYGDFIVQEVGQDESAYTATFTSMWVLA